MAKNVLLSARIPSGSQAGVPNGFNCITNQGVSLGNFTRAQLSGGTIVSVADTATSITCDSSGTTCNNQDTAVIQAYTTTYNVYINSQQYLCPNCTTFGSANVTLSIPTTIGVSPGDFVSVDSSGGYLVGTYSTTTSSPTGVILIGASVYASCVNLCAI